MTETTQVALEIGPKGKRMAAVALHWPGLERGGKTEQEALDNLRAYLSRYSPVAQLAKMDAAFDAIRDFGVVEQYQGTGSTDYWGISFAFSSFDQQDLSQDELDRELTLMQACWAFFDDVASRVSVEMQKGPRGGGRDRDQIIGHAFRTEQDWAEKVGVFTPDDALLTDAGIKAHRKAYCQAIRDYHGRGIMPGKIAKWPIRFLIRHTAYHTLDHAWEMEDKDLTGKEG